MIVMMMMMMTGGSLKLAAVLYGEHFAGAFGQNPYTSIDLKQQRQLAVS